MNFGSGTFACEPHTIAVSSIMYAVSRTAADVSKARGLDFSDFNKKIVVWSGRLRDCRKGMTPSGTVKRVP